MPPQETGRPQSPAPDVSVLIVTYNVRDFAVRCLESLPAAFTPTDGSSATTWEAIVVDNQSHDGTPDVLRDRFPSLTLIESPVNDGFGGGLNRAARHARANLLFILNPDTEVEPGAAAELARFLQRSPRIAAVGPRLVNNDGSTQSSRRRFPTLGVALIESTPLQPLFEHSNLLGRYYMRDRPDDQSQQVDWLVGAAFVTRQSVWDRLGGFDPRFFLYFEETDWFKRLAAFEPPTHPDPHGASPRPAGSPVATEVWYLPAARVLHHSGQSADQNLGQRHIIFQDSKCKYHARHHGPVAGTLLRAYLLGWSTYQLLQESAKYLLGHKRALRRSRMRDLTLALRSGLHST